MKQRRNPFGPEIFCIGLALLLTGCAPKQPALTPGESYLADLETRDVAELQKEIREAKDRANAESEESGNIGTELGREPFSLPGEGQSHDPEAESESESESNLSGSEESETDKDTFEVLLAELRAQVEAGEVTELTPEELGKIKNKLERTVIVGDSMAQAVLEYDLLPESQVYFQRGGITRELGPTTDRALSMYPENVIFFTGLNDADHETYDSYPEAYAERVAQVRAALPDAKIWICSMTPPSNDLGAVREDLARAPVFDGVLEAWCDASPDATYIDLKWMVRQDWYLADGIHFKKSFYLIWLQYTEGLLEESGSL